MMKLRHPDDAVDLMDLERVWQAEVEEIHTALLIEDRAHFEHALARLDDLGELFGKYEIAA